MDDKKQRIRELEKEYLKLSRKEAGLVRQQQNYLIDTTKERKKLDKCTEHEKLGWQIFLPIQTTSP